VLLHSSSGIGKSSLINAGVVPLLKQRNDVSWFNIRFGSYVENSSNTPLQTVLHAVAQPQTSTCLQRIAFDNESLWHRLKELQINDIQTTGKDKTFYLIFDQFEELFSYPDEQVFLFKKQLSETLHSVMPNLFRKVMQTKLNQNPDLLQADEMKMLNTSLNIKVLLAIRADRMSLLNQLTDYLPEVFRSIYELKPLTKQQATLAITAPAAMQGDFVSPVFAYSNGALDTILDYLTGKDTQRIESFQLQIVCRFAEQYVLRRQPTDQSVFTVLSEHLGDISSILQNFYDELLEKLDYDNGAQKLKLQEVLEEDLIFEADERRLLVYEKQILQKISARLLKQIADTHFIRSEPYSSGGFSYELSHDTLVKPLLKSKALRKEKERQIIEEQKRKIEEAEHRRKQRRRILIAGSIAAVIIIFLTTITVSVNNERKKVVAEKKKVDQQKLELQKQRDSLNLLYVYMRDKNKEVAQKEYQKLVAEGNAMKGNKNYGEAIAKYQNAIFQVRGYNLDSLEAMNNIGECRKLIGSSNQFEQLIAQGDAMSGNESQWAQALRKYKDAKATGTNNTLADNKIKSMEQQIEAKFTVYKDTGLEALKLGNAPGKMRAKQLFEKALALKPDDAFVKLKLKECE